jgi:plastocyanin
MMAREMPRTTEMSAMEGGMAMDGDMSMDHMAGDTVVIEIQSLKYSEEELVIEAGTTALWKNSDPLQHTVTADDDSFDSGLIDPQQSFAMTFDTPGTYADHCTPHPFMMARVVVREMMEDTP